MLAWTEHHFDADPDWRLRTLALGPDGSPRGEPRTVFTGIDTSAPQILVEPGGSRAPAIYTDERGVPGARSDLATAEPPRTERFHGRSTSLSMRP